MARCRDGPRLRDRLATHDLAVAMDFRSPGKVAKAHDITDLLVAEGVDTREDLHAWIARPAGRAALRAVKGVGPKSVDYMGNLVGRSQVAVDVHLRTFAADAGVPQLGYGQLRAAYEEAAALLGHEPGALEHAVWRAGAGLDAAWASLSNLAQLRSAVDARKDSTARLKGAVLSRVTMWAAAANRWCPVPGTARAMA
ncbi:hypothetical protein [Streptomyces sp. NPDC059538]|uniref:hypothetical protein n=1 Tax=Streptomyces sp. NPDC059538 TaxID=3346860 RepID=UPI0036BFBAE8